MGRWSESEVLGLFDAYYVGIQVVSSTVVLPDNDAYANRSSDKWLWWEGAHFDATPYTGSPGQVRSEEHTSELQSRPHLVCRLLLEKKNRSVKPRGADHL